MTTEKILKKEDKLEYKSGIFNKRGTLVLTTSELYFLLGENKKAFHAPVKDILSVSAQKGLGNGIDHLHITYTEDGKEKKVKIQHMAFWSGLAMGNVSQLREPYFRSWENAIENARSGNTNNSNLDDLEKLASLKEKGVITEEEFQAKKKQLLGL